MTITADDLVRREFHYCVSALVSTLAGYTPRMSAYEDARHDRDNKALMDLTAQAQELASSVPDYEAAAIEHDPNFALYQTTDGVWRWRGEYEDDCRDNASREIAAEEFCLTAGIDPIEHEVYEHWIVSDWLAEKLAAKGEKVDTDFAGLTVWARTTTGQGIASDSVIQDIVADLNKPEA
jgi:hypothetical protein